MVRLGINEVKIVDKPIKSCDNEIDGDISKETDEAFFMA